MITLFMEQMKYKIITPKVFLSLVLVLILAASCTCSKGLFKKSCNSCIESYKIEQCIAHMDTIPLTPRQTAALRTLKKSYREYKISRDTLKSLKKPVSREVKRRLKTLYNVKCKDFKFQYERNLKPHLKHAQ